MRYEGNYLGIDIYNPGPDNNGNARKVVFHSHIILKSEDYMTAIKAANKWGGKKYHNRQFGGGLVFQESSPKAMANFVIGIWKDRMDKKPAHHQLHPITSRAARVDADLDHDIIEALYEQGPLKESTLIAKARALAQERLADSIASQVLCDRDEITGITHEDPDTIRGAKIYSGRRVYQALYESRIVSDLPFKREIYYLEQEGKIKVEPAGHYDGSHKPRTVTKIL